MPNFTLYNGCTAIDIQSATIDDNITYITKLCSHKSQIFLLTQHNDLYIGHIDDQQSQAIITRLKSNIVDIECTADTLFSVDDSGSVYQISLSNLALNEWTEIVVPNPKTCPHGIKSNTEKVRISKINCNNDGILFTTINHELFAMGHFGDVLQSDCPVPVESFSGFKILQVTTGDRFVVVLTYKKPHTGHAEDDFSEEDHSDDVSPVYLNTECPKCAPETLIVQHPSTTETSMASSGSQSDVFEDMWASTTEATTIPLHIGTVSEPLKSHKEVALNFLLESLSITSEDAGKQTKLIKDNVSNITSMVCEGVRTLSRHMSGSDSNEAPEIESSYDDLMDGKSLKTVDVSDCAESLCEDSSLGIGSAVDLQSECEMESKISKICRFGASILGTGVWCFGSINKGHLGTGDHMKRTRIHQILGLTGQGVTKISSGPDHSIAVTLDGRLYLWGSNGHQQICTEEIEDVSSPRRFRNAENTLDAVCGAYSTVVLLNDLQVHEMRSKSHEQKTKAFIKSSESSSKDYPICLASNKFLIQNHSKVESEIQAYLTAEQKFLQEMLVSYLSSIKPFLKKLYFINKSQIIDHLCMQFLNIINMTTVNLKSMLEYFNGRRSSCQEILVLMNAVEMISAYRTYTRCYCDVTAMQGFNQINAMMEKLDKNPGRIFSLPFRRVTSYVEFICDLLNRETSEVYKVFLIDRRSAWERFKIEKDLAIEFAMNTSRFWEANGKSLVAKLQVPERRLIVDSKEIPLKILPSGRFATHWLILFNDIFCHHSNSGGLKIYPLKTLWVTSLNDTETRKNAFKVITPEDSYVFVAKQYEDKQKWFESIENGIRHCLDKQSAMSSKVPQYRNASFTFSDKHPKYAGVKYFGRWCMGQMQGIGHLEFPDDKVFNGQMVNGEIHGFGRMYTPTVGIYAGDFANGKYHGHGMLERKHQLGTFEGNFKDGLFHGHGTLRTDSYTYIGEFVANQKSGYGVLDDSISGDKYMGMFVDDKRNGFGTLITMDGNYFEGIFVGDALAGDGVAVFENGSYYEGELTIGGPNGKGTFCLPRSEVKSGEDIEFNERNIEMTGNVLLGSLGGTWTNVKINNGNISMNDSFPKIPRTLGIRSTEINRKWRSLFQDWEFDVFGDVTSSLTYKEVWNKIAVFITNAKRKEKLKSDSLSTHQLSNWNNAQSKPSIHSDLVTLNNETNSNSNSSRFVKQVDRISLHSTTQSISSHYSKKGLHHQLHTKIDEFIEEANKFNDTIAANRSLSNHNGLSRPPHTNEMLYDNLKNEATNLTEIFKNKRDVAEKLLNAAALEYGGSGCGNSSDCGASNYKRYRPSKGSLDFIPSFGMVPGQLYKHDLMSVKSYLTDAFSDPHHPVCVLNAKISFCFYTSYGCWKVKPTSILSGQAMVEWEYISKKIYTLVRRMFPALPMDSDKIDGEIVSFRSLLYPILLSERVYSTLFVLYASKCSQNDELYRQRVLVCDRKTDSELASFLRISNLLPVLQCDVFAQAIASLKQVKEQYCPREMLNQIEHTFQLIEEAKMAIDNFRNMLNADSMIPVTIFLILRAGIPHLGAEILLMEDLIGNDYDSVIIGFAGYSFVTIKATYQHILSNKFFQD